MNKTVILFAVLALFSMACNKAGVGGKATISGAVMHNDDAIPSAIVYIKYGADAFPGFDLDQYDDQATASATDASYSFTNLYKGDYYVYATGFDTVGQENVSGGIPVVIEKKKDNIEINVPVVK